MCCARPKRRNVHDRPCSGRADLLRLRNRGSSFRQNEITAVWALGSPRGQHLGQRGPVNNRKNTGGPAVVGASTVPALPPWSRRNARQDKSRISAADPSVCDRNNSAAPWSLVPAGTGTGIMNRSHRRLAKARQWMIRYLHLNTLRSQYRIHLVPVPFCRRARARGGVFCAGLRTRPSLIGAHGPGSCQHQPVSRSCRQLVRTGEALMRLRAL
jgi:hypothetical protein